MRVKVVAAFAGNWPDGRIHVPTPGEVIEVPDDDAVLVGYLRAMAGAGYFEILEDAVDEAPDDAPPPANPPEKKAVHKPARAKDAALTGKATDE